MVPSWPVRRRIALSDPPRSECERRLRKRVYGTRADPWETLTRPVLKDLGAKRIIAHGIPTATTYRTLNEPRRPRRANRDQLQAAAVAFANERLAEWDLAVPSHASETLAAYLHERELRGESTRRCAWCGEPMPPGARADSRYHNNACRQAARRARLRT
jgi:hypothetical protein